MSEEDFINDLFYRHKKAQHCPSPTLVTHFFKNVLGFLFPEHSEITYENASEFSSAYAKLQADFLHILSLRRQSDVEQDRSIVARFLHRLPEIRKMLENDIDAMYTGDPAARNQDEVIRTYPGFYAIAAYRIAHILHNEGLQLIARMISSHAHNHTGIDIHPAATIGAHFCIDHGTGIVIGETTEIGNHVKIYQGVTLGALSVKKEDAATKRHPIIEDHVVIYAGASILGGKTRVGHHSIIGGNV